MSFSALNDMTTLARELAAAEPRDSRDRRAWLCVAVCLSTTGTAAAARKALAEVGSLDVRQRAIVLLADLMAGGTG